MTNPPEWTPGAIQENQRQADNSQLAKLASAVLLGSLTANLFTASLPLYLARDQGYSVAVTGILIGLAFVPQLVAPVLIGPLIDRGGAHLALRLGATCLLMASLLLLSSHDVFVIGTARCLQGLGLALLVPSMYSLVPRLVRPKFIGTAVGGFGAFNNIGIALGPPVGLFLLRRGPMWLFGAALITAAVTAFATAILHPVKQRTPPARLFTYRASWTALLLIVFLTTTYFGVLLAYLPINVPESNVSSVAWFFSADAVGVLAFRVPAGIFTDRYGPRWLLVSGVVATVAATVLLLAPASNVLFAVAGIGTGVGTALLLPPILVELTARSDEGSRGTAMALYSMSLAAAIATGSFGAAPLVEHFGFQTTLLLGLVLCICAGPIAFVGLRPRPLRSGY